MRLEEQIGRIYTEKPIGSEPKRFLPLEEPAGLIVVDGLRKLPQEGLQSKLEQIATQVLQTENSLEELKILFLDVGLFFNKREMKSLNADIRSIKKNDCPTST